ncbi:unnamed protein product [Clonostachys rosea f. rosea IK726]|uniref:Fungal-type protein kinase domain-containing protein n=2 Tax=Bionectria ochroleuca TaxID=29856 RepID=A0A0B7KKY6_BIOOC|nr:unnamed protein product [Clonostachys rosea f. rosea IK726]
MPINESSRTAQTPRQKFKTSLAPAAFSKRLERPVHCLEIQYSIASVDRYWKGLFVPLRARSSSFRFFEVLSSGHFCKMLTRFNKVTGIQPFMAVDILLDKRHWYRHDLELFLYLLIWSIITEGSGSVPQSSKLRMWAREDWDDIAVRKRSQMEQWIR